MLCDEIASGGMASVHLGLLRGSAGFSRTVAIKRLHAEFARDPDFVAMLIDEGRLVSKIRHPNVVAALDVVSRDGELFLVMDYVAGETLARPLHASSAGERDTPIAVAVGIMIGVLMGLHAAHDAVGANGVPLGIVHRDVSPHNVLVGSDGVARIADFGIAMATSRVQSTRDGQVKGKLRYMAPEHLRGEAVDRRADVYAAALVLWELLTGRRFTDAPDLGGIVHQVLSGRAVPPSSVRPHVPQAIDAIVLRGLADRKEDRFTTGREMAVALEKAAAPATAREIGDWVQGLVGAALRERAAKVAAIEAAAAPVTSTASFPANEPTTEMPADLSATHSVAAVLPADERSITGETPPASPPAAAPDRTNVRRKWARLGVLGAALTAVGALTALGAARQQKPLESTDAALGAETSEPRSTEEAEALTGGAPSRSGGAGAAASSSPSAAPPSSSPPVVGPAPPRRVHPKNDATRGRCDPPYAIENGMKRWKPECL